MRGSLDATTVSSANVKASEGWREADLCEQVTDRQKMGT